VGWGGGGLRRAGSLRSFTALRKEAGLFCGSFLRKGEVSAYVELIQNLKDLNGEGENRVVCVVVAFFENASVV
jgi:hypothetical protein